MRRLLAPAFMVALLATALAWPQPACTTLRGPAYQRAGVDVDGDGAYEYIVEINHWNLESAKGESSLTYCPLNHTVSYTQDLYSMVPRRSTVYGYPEVYYGYKPWNGVQADDGEVELPLPLLKAEPLWAAVNYTLTHQPRLPINLALDLWLTREERPRRVGKGDAEVMVWLYHSGLRPAGSPVATARCPAYIDGRPVTASFTLWEARFSWLYLAYVLDTPRPRGEVAVNLGCILLHAAKRHPWLARLYLEDVELGTEYGLPGVQRAVFRWSIYRFTVTRHDPEKPVPVELRAADSRGNPVAGAKFWVNGRLAGETRGDGVLRVELKPGYYTVAVQERLSSRGAVYTFKGWGKGGNRSYTLLVAGREEGVTAVYAVEQGSPERPAGEAPAPAPKGGNATSAQGSRPRPVGRSASPPNVSEETGAQRGSEGPSAAELLAAAAAIGVAVVAAVAVRKVLGKL